MTQSLQDFIGSIRLAESNEHERFLINSEQADIRTYIRECDPSLRPRIVAKMVFLSTLGENVAYGQMEVLTLMSHDVYSYKRIGYIAAGAILDESSELTVLITHTITKDLKGFDHKTQCLALALLSNIGSVEMCRNVSAEVLRLLESANPSVMKRAAMAGVRIIERCPDLAENYRGSIHKLLKQGTHGVVSAAINLMTRIIIVDGNSNGVWDKHSTAFTKLLKQLSTSKASKEFSFYIFNDPFLQIKIMKVLALLKKPSDDLDDVLESIATGVDVRRNTGRAILFQAVETIVATAKKPTLRGLAFAQIGRLFQVKEANILYSALSVFSRVLYSGREIIDRTSGDSIALQRYKTQVVSCLSHRDPSIRRRALDVISALVDEKNVETLIPEVLDYLKLADSDFRVELVAKIFTAVQRFAPNPIWNFDTIHRILIDSGNYVGNDIMTSITRLLIRTPSIQSHAIKQLSGSMMGFSDNQTLMQVTAWVLGEFLKVDDGSYENMKQIMHLPQTTDVTKGYLMTALAKLSVRINRKQDIINFFNLFTTSSSLDVQQRAGELAVLMSNNDICDEVLAPVECDTSSTATIVVENKLETDLLDLTGSGSQQQKSTNIIDDILGLSSTPQQQAQVQQAAPAQQQSAPQSQNIGPPPNAVEALNKHDYVIYFEIIVNPQNSSQIAIRASIFNNSSAPLNNFQIKFGVPVGWSIKAKPPSGTVLAPKGGTPILQELYLQREADTQLIMKTQVQYLYGSQPVTETGVINPIFS